MKQWKMDDFQRGRVVFAFSVVSHFAPLLCQEGSQRAQLSIQRRRWQAKNILHLLWNTLPLLICLLTPPDLFTRPSQQKQKTHLTENNTYVINRHAWIRSGKQKHSKNICVWLENGFIFRAVCVCVELSGCVHLALTQSQREKVVILQTPPTPHPRDASMLWHSNIG